MRILPLNSAGLGIEVTDMVTRSVRAYDGACHGMCVGYSDVDITLVIGVLASVEEEVEIC